LLVLDDVTVSQPKTKMLAALLKGLKVDKALVVVDQISRELALASRNIPGWKWSTALNLNSLQVVKYPKILISKAALEQVQIRLEVAQEKAS
jgi:large subunit ribosomal protein L4